MGVCGEGLVVIRNDRLFADLFRHDVLDREQRPAYRGGESSAGVLEDVEDEVVPDGRLARGGNRKIDFRISSGVGLSCLTGIPDEASSSCNRFKNSLAFIYFVVESLTFREKVSASPSVE